jgi:uracil-DNA glycosylase
MNAKMTTLDRQLGAHRKAMQQCRRCEHPKDVQPIISIARSPRVMLVGQAPGRTEAGGGRPFAGRAGRTLFGWLASVGIDESTFRDRVYISAVTRCYPGPSASGRGDRVPGSAERENCSGWLSAELRLIRPVLIIPVGRLAIDVFLGRQPLEDVIGREHPVTDATGRMAVAVPLPHPSGASSWIHTLNHGQLLDGALDLIARRWARVEGQRGKRVA